MSNRYAVSDLHGQFDLFTQIKEYINEDDIVYALGDFGDRGPEPWRTLQAVLDDSQFIYLMGNHDLMLAKSIDFLTKVSEDEWESIMWPFYSRPAMIADLFDNGGEETLIEWIENSNRMKYYKQLCNLPALITLPAKDKKHLIYLSHAGYNPGISEEKMLEDFVWDREHFYRHYNGNNLIIHGHTPILLMDNFLDKEEYSLKDGYCLYNDNLKINIDRGAHVTGETVLLNIDTREGKVFKVRDNINESEN